MTAGKADLPPLFAIIVAGGSGLRAGGGLPKQFHDLCGEPVFLHSIRRFKEANPITQIIIVTHRDYRDMVEREMEKAALEAVIVDGGNNRWESVSHGLDAIEAASGFVAVHDAARPLVSAGTIETGWREAMLHDAAVPCVPVTDSLRIKTADGTESVDRSLYMAVQTPQVFNLELLRMAYSEPYKETFTDDASVVEAFGHDVAVFAGTPENIKITTPADFEIARVIMNGRI